MIFFYGNSEINLIRKLFEQTKNDTNFVVANLIGNCLLMEDFKYENYTDTEE